MYKRQKLDTDFEDGKITKRQRDYGMMRIDQNLDDKMRRRDLEVAQKEFMDYGKQLDTAVQNRDRLQDKDCLLYTSLHGRPRQE